MIKTLIILYTENFVSICKVSKLFYNPKMRCQLIWEQTNIKSYPFSLKACSFVLHFSKSPKYQIKPKKKNNMPKTKRKIKLPHTTDDWMTDWVNVLIDNYRFAWQHFCPQRGSHNSIIHLDDPHFQWVPLPPKSPTCVRFCLVAIQLGREFSHKLPPFHVYATEN